jgi:hypothetical protein
VYLGHTAFGRVAGMGWLEYFKSPKQEKDERAIREAHREAEEGSDLGNALNDLFTRRCSTARSFLIA